MSPSTKGPAKGESVNGDGLPVADARLAEGIRALPGLPAARRTAMRAELDALAAELLPAQPPDPVGESGPSGPTLATTLAIVGLGLVLALLGLSTAWNRGSGLKPEPVDQAGTAAAPGGADSAELVSRVDRTATPAVTATHVYITMVPGATQTVYRVAIIAPPATLAPTVALGRRAGNATKPPADGRPTPDPNDFDHPPPGGSAYPGPPVPTDFGTVSGRVISDTGEPIAGAKVSLVSIAGSTAKAEQLTDSDGRFAIPVEPGVYDVRAEAEGFEEQWFEGHKSRKDADPIAIEPGGRRDSVAFMLIALPSPTPPGYPGP